MRYILFLFLILSSSSIVHSGGYDLISPGKKLMVRVTTGETISYQVHFNGKEVIAPSVISMQLEGATLGLNSKLIRTETKEERNLIIPEIPQRRNKIPDNYNQTIFYFRGGFSVIFRLYDDAFAWRFRTSMKENITVISEQAEFNFIENFFMYIPSVHCRQEVDCFHSSFEENYEHVSLGEWKEEVMAFLPILVNSEGSPKMIITEADLIDYPGMWIEKGKAGDFALAGKFAGYPEEENIFGGEYKQKLVTKRAKHIAVTGGTRDFPWRVIAFAENDKSLLNNDIVYKLASPNRLGDVSWIKPGISTDEWIVSRNFYGVDFKTGFNTETYRYLIDFASDFGLEYMMFDAGWSDQNDLLKITPGIDLPYLIEYASQKNVGILLWTLAMTVEKQMEEAFDRFQEMGIKGIMVDFMDRDDQATVNFYEKVLKEAAERKLFVNFHGAFKETGLNRAYPNLITREGVLGHEYNMWSDRVTPGHNLLIAFIRNFAGPMDYEGGCMNNAQKDAFRVNFSDPVSQGTRVHQLAHYIAYISPLQYVAGNFSEYLEEPEYARILCEIPTTWDETIPLDAQLGKYLVIARKKLDVWYVAGLNNWDARDIEVDLSFLDNSDYEATIVSDGINAETYAEDYKITLQKVKKETKLKIHLAPGGGWFVKLVKTN